MNLTTISTASLATLFLVACGPSEAEIAEAKAKATADSLANVAAMEKSYAIDPAASTIKWNGVMVGVKNHFGTVNLTQGSLSVKGSQVTGGTFTADLNTIAPLDTNFTPDGSKQGTKGNLVGHLQSADFFDVANHPTATLEITGGSGNTATCNLTVRGQTHPEQITDITVTEEMGTVKATGKLTFDRQKYGVAFKMPMADMVISDNIELEVEVSGGTAQ